MTEAKRTTVWLYPVDLESIDRIRARWGLGTGSDAVRLALRVLAASPSVQLEPTSREGESSLFTLWRYPVDQEAIRTLSRGELTDADVIRGAIRLFAEVETLTIA